MKKITLYINSMKPAGGIERVVSSLANELCKNNDVRILVKDDHDSFYPLDSRIKLTSINSKLELNMNSRFSRGINLVKSFLISSFKLRSFFKSNDFDYIYVTTPLAFWECFLTGMCKDKIIASEHGARTNYNSIYRFLKKGYKNAAFYMVPTTDDYNYYLDKKYPVVHIPHLRPSLNYHKSDVVIKKVVNIGRYTNDKQQLNLVAMWSQLVHAGKVRDWKLVIVGTGELEYELRSLIKQLKMGDYIELIPPRKDIEKVYLDASLFVLSSSSEGFGMVVLEALSFGLPVVSFDCPSGPKDIITNNRDGFLVELNDFNALSRSLSLLIENDNLRNEMSDYGYNRMKNWNAENIMTRFEDML